MSIKNNKHNARSIYYIKYVTCAKVLQDLNQHIFSEYRFIPTTFLFKL